MLAVACVELIFSFLRRTPCVFYVIVAPMRSLSPFLSRQAYAQKTGTSATTLRLHFDGNRLDDEQTPEELEMEEHDVLDVILNQTGGSC